MSIAILGPILGFLLGLLLKSMGYSWDSWQYWGVMVIVAAMLILQGAIH